MAMFCLAEVVYMTPKFRIRQCCNVLKHVCFKLCCGSVTTFAVLSLDVLQIDVYCISIVCCYIKVPECATLNALY